MEIDASGNQLKFNQFYKTTIYKKLCEPKNESIKIKKSNVFKLHIA